MKIWQAMDIDGNITAFTGYKPMFDKLRDKYLPHSSLTKILDGFVLPIRLKPLQIAEITFHDGGTWTYEIERKEGFYFVKNISSGMVLHLKYSKGSWFYPNGEEFLLSATRTYTISKNRIPDECLI